MSIFTLNGKRINIEVPYTDPVTGEYGISLKDPAQRARFNIVEVAEPVKPVDFHEDTHFRTESDVAPFVVYTKKQQEMIDATTYNKGMAQIKAIEQAELMPRTLREFLLEQPGASAKPWFAKINKLHNDIEAIKAALPPAPPPAVP